jgi:hypothetical protein
MPVYQEMPPEVIEKILEGYEDALEPEWRKQEAFYRQFACPRCEGRCEKAFISIKHAFGDGALVARSGLQCTLCSCLFDPHSGLIVNLGNMGQINERIHATQMPWLDQED